MLEIAIHAGEDISSRLGETFNHGSGEPRRCGSANDADARIRFGDLCRPLPCAIGRVVIDNYDFIVDVLQGGTQRSHERLDIISLVVGRNYYAEPQHVV